MRHAPITSEYALDRGLIHSSRSSINASTGSANVTSLAATRALGLWPLVSEVETRLKPLNHKEDQIDTSSHQRDIGAAP